MGENFKYVTLIHMNKFLALIQWLERAFKLKYLHIASLPWQICENYFIIPSVWSLTAPHTSFFPFSTPSSTPWSNPPTSTPPAYILMNILIANSLNHTHTTWSVFAGFYISTICYKQIQYWHICGHRHWHTHHSKQEVMWPCRLW